jgi:hypothetical protein
MNINAAINAAKAKAMPTSVPRRLNHGVRGVTVGGVSSITSTGMSSSTTRSSLP